MSMEVGRIDLGLDVNQAYFNRQMRNLSGGAERSVTSAFGGLGKKIGAALGIAAVVQFTKSCISLGSDLAEVQNVVDTTFTSMANQVNEFASTAIDTFGLSETVAKKYMGTLGTMSKSMGVSEAIAYDMAEAITGLSGDVASFYNLSSNEAYTKLKSIWTGETESLKDLGIVMTQTALDQYALNNGFGKTTARMTEQEKLMLRYQYVMSGLSAAQGDFVKTQDGWANQARVLSLRFDQLRATLGQGFINALLPVIKMLNGIIERLQVAANAFVDFTKVIFGIKEASSSGSSSASAMLDGVTDSANSAGGAIAAANKQLSGFDKLNNVGSSDSSSGDGGSGITIPSIGDYESGSSDELINNSSMVRWLDVVKEKLEPTKIALTNLYNDAIKPLINFTGTALYDFYNNFLKPVGGWVLGTGLPGLVDSCTNLFKFIDWDKLNKALGGLWTALAPFAIAVGDGLISFLKNASEFIGKGIGELFSLVADGVKTISGAIGGTDSRIIESAGKAIGELLGALLIFKGATALGGILSKTGIGLGKILGIVSKYKPVFAVVGGVVIAKFFASLFDSVSGAERDALDQSISDLNLSMDDLDEALERARSNYSNLEAENRSMEITVDAYFKLANKKILTDEEQDLLKAYGKLLTDNFPALDKVIDAHTGAYKGTEAEIRNMIKAHQAYVMEVAAEDASIEITKQLMETQIAYEKANNEFQKASERLANKSDSLPDWITDSRYDNPISGWLYNFSTANENEDYRKAYDSVSEAGELLKQAEEDQKWYLEQAAFYADKYTKEIALSTTTMSNENKLSVKTSTTAFSNLAKGVSSNSTIAKNSLQIGLTGMTSALTTFYNNTRDTTKSIKSTISSMASEVAKKTGVAASEIASLMTKLSNAKVPDIAVTGAITAGFKVPKLASGGYVAANTPQLAMIGDNRHQGEVVAPEGKMQDMAQTAAKLSSDRLALLIAEQNALLKEILGVGKSIDSKPSGAVIDRSTLFNVTREEAKRFTKKTGKPAFV